MISIKGSLLIIGFVLVHVLFKNSVAAENHSKVSKHKMSEDTSLKSDATQNIHPINDPDFIFKSSSVPHSTSVYLQPIPSNNTGITSNTNGSSTQTPMSTSTTTSSAPATTSETKPSDTNTTSSAAPLTTVPTPTTAPPTTPAPSPTPSNALPWNVTENNMTCILATMEINITIPYLTIDNKTAIANMLITPNTVPCAEGTCVGNQTLEVLWENGAIRFVFDMNKSKSKYYLANITISVNAINNTNFPNISDQIKWFNLSYSAAEGAMFDTPAKMSYLCSAPQNIDLKGEGLTNNTHAQLSLSAVHVEAFISDAKNSQFSAAMDCSYVETPDFVPIAVGCALAGLVVVVLIAYLVGRRRSQARGYLSM